MNLNVNGPSVVIGRSGTIGIPQYIEEDFWPHNTTLFIKNLKKNDARYLYYLLLNLNIENLKTGSNIPTLNRNHLHPLKVKATKNVVEQKKIISILTKLDYKIELNNNIITELEVINKEIYNYWFIQLEFPDKQNKPYRTNDGRTIWNSELKREIPYNWKVSNLYDDKYTRKIKAGLDNFNEEKIYLATANVDKNDIVGITTKVTYKNKPLRANMKLSLNSIYFAKMKNSKKILYISDIKNDLYNNYIISTGFAGIEVMDKFMFDYVLEYIRTDSFNNNKDMLSNGATQQAINDENIKNIKILIPDKYTIKKYYQLVHKNNIQICDLKSQNIELKKIRDFLLPLLINGQVKVK